MKKLMIICFSALFLSTSFFSCREKEEEMTEEEKVIQEMKEEGAEIDVKRDDDEVKIKMETENKEVKIKTEDGESKIKIKTEDDDN